MIEHVAVVNTDPKLIGKTALMRERIDSDMCWVQFDDVDLEYNGVMLGYGWHEMMRDIFKRIE